MRQITSESPNGKQRIIIDPSSETVTFFGCFAAPATSFFSIPRFHPEFVCRFEDILDVHVERRGSGPWMSRRMHLRLCRRQIVTAHGSVLYRGNWTNFDETWDMLQAISESTPDAPMLTNFNIAGPLVIGGLFIIALIFILIYFWLTGN